MKLTCILSPAGEPRELQQAHKTQQDPSLEQDRSEVLDLAAAPEQSQQQFNEMLEPPVCQCSKCEAVSNNNELPTLMEDSDDSDQQVGTTEDERKPEVVKFTRHRTSEREMLRSTRKVKKYLIFKVKPKNQSIPLDADQVINIPLSSKIEQDEEQQE